MQINITLKEVKKSKAVIYTIQIFNVAIELGKDHLEATRPKLPWKLF